MRERLRAKANQLFAAYPGIGRWGYDLLEHLPSLTLEIGDWKRVRHNYFQTQLDLFIARWAKPYFEYCEKNNLEFTGH